MALAGQAGITKGQQQRVLRALNGAQAICAGHGSRLTLSYVRSELNSAEPINRV